MFSVPDILQKLHGLGIGSLMVEGGASVIASFLDAASSIPAPGGECAVDTLIVTVAPSMVGDEGVGYSVNQVCWGISRFKRFTLMVTLA